MNHARALRAATKLTCQIGPSSADPIMLSRSRQLCLLLPDLSIVARISSATTQNINAATRELEVARYLYGKDAPVVGPHERMPLTPFIEDGLAITLWPHIVHEKADEDDDEKQNAAAHALQRVHEALAAYPGNLPAYTEKIEACAALLQRPAALPAMAADDRLFLTNTYERLHVALTALPIRPRPIHGDSHMGNVFFTANGPLWTDFEAASLGPYEWDAACLPNPSAFRSADPQTYAVMKHLRSLCVAVWCSTPTANPSQREAAQYHLERLRNGLHHGSDS